jgi:predicted lipoprotein with Yx(FWY)xxD motif
MKGKLIATLLVGGVALVTAACGGASTYGSGGGNAPATAAAPASASANVGQSSLGHIIVDGQGRTLYLFEKDKGTASSCYGSCASIWPPALASGTPMAGTGANAALLGVTRRTDGGMQLTYAGHPLYRYAADTKPGQTTGEGSMDFGAGWDVLSPSGSKVEAAASSSSSSPSSGYGW